MLAPSRHPSGAVTHTHARACSLSAPPEPYLPPPPSSFGTAESERLHSNCDLSRPWHGMVMTGTRPSAGHASESVCRRCRGQAERPCRRRPLSRATCRALTAADGAQRRHAPMSREARVRQPEAGGSAPQRDSAACHVRA